METRLSLAPEQNGTKKLLAIHGDRLVRYRYDATRQLRHKLWEVDWKTVCAIGLQDRVVDEPRETPIHP